MPASFSRALQALAVQLGLVWLLLAPRGDAQAALPIRRTVAVAHYYFERLGASNGLQQSSIGGIYQDARGFLWIA